MNSHHTVAIGTWEGDKQQSIEYNSSIAVGIDCPRAKLRVSILLDTIQEYQVRYIFSDEEISEAVNEAGLIIGARGIAYEGVLQRKPVIVVGEYGFGGLVTPDTLHEQYNNYFRGLIPHGLHRFIRVVLRRSKAMAACGRLILPWRLFRFPARLHGRHLLLLRCLAADASDIRAQLR